MSPGWQSKALQIASKVENRIALALPFFKIDRLAHYINTFVTFLGTLPRLELVTVLCSHLQELITPDFILKLNVLKTHLKIKSFSIL